MIGCDYQPVTFFIEDVLVDVIEAGRKGGLTVLRKFGREFYVGIGQKGQKSMRCKYPGMAKVWGKRGGRPKKPNLDDMGDQGINKKRGGSGSASSQ